MTGVAKTVNDNKAAQHQLEELKRHNRVIDGYFVIQKRTRSLNKKKKRERNIKNAKRCYHQRTITTIDKSYVHSISEVFSHVLSYQQEYVETKMVL